MLVSLYVYIYICTQFLQKIHYFRKLQKKIFFVQIICIFMRTNKYHNTNNNNRRIIRTFNCKNAIYIFMCALYTGNKKKTFRNFKF